MDLSKCKDSFMTSPPELQGVRCAYSYLQLLCIVIMPQDEAERVVNTGWNDRPLLIYLIQFCARAESFTTFAPPDAPRGADAHELFRRAAGSARCRHAEALADVGQRLAP